MTVGDKLQIDDVWQIVERKCQISIDQELGVV